MSDTWDVLQNLKSRTSSLKEKLLKRKQAVEVLQGTSSSLVIPKQEKVAAAPVAKKVKKLDERLEREALDALSEISATESGTDGFPYQRLTAKLSTVSHMSDLNVLMMKFVAQGLLKMKHAELNVLVDDEKLLLMEPSQIFVTDLDLNKVDALLATDRLVSKTSTSNVGAGAVKSSESESAKEARKDHGQQTSSKSVDKADKPEDCLEDLLTARTTKEKHIQEMTTEIQQLLNRPTAKEEELVQKLNNERAIVRQFCPHMTRRNCGDPSCARLHFRRIIKRHTDVSLGDCSFLNTCFHMNTCKYVHYEVERTTGRRPTKNDPVEKPVQNVRVPPQWIQCDLRNFDLTVLGKFAVIMADPPWDIHMELPYGTMQDQEMRNLPVPEIQDEGFIFLWVTGRAMELGRECLKKWGYERCDELVWVKTNQLQKIVRTGRTGHWLNHGKEHCLVGRKGACSQFSAGIDCDVIVSEVRATSHKPDEIYGIIERLAPGMRKVELFGRMHNIQPNWVTLGNQLDGVRLFDPEIVRRYRQRYPNGYSMPTKARPSGSSGRDSPSSRNGRAN